MIQLVIEIPEEDYEYLKLHNKDGLYNAILNGKPLPKGHGRLIDADELYLDIQTDEEMRLGEENLLWVRERIYDVAPTIIEADKEG